MIAPLYSIEHDYLTFCQEQEYHGNTVAQTQRDLELERDLLAEGLRRAHRDQMDAIGTTCQRVYDASVADYLERLRINKAKRQGIIS